MDIRQETIRSVAPTTKSTTTVADAIRKVTARVQNEMEAGRRSTRIDAHDLVDLLLAIADDIELHAD